MKRSSITRVAKNLLYYSGVIPMLRSRPESSAPIIRVLAYHSVSPATATYCKSGIRVSPAHFDEQMAYLSRHYQILSMDEAVAHLTTARDLPRNAVVITFDDGYRDNYIYAWPILRKWRVTATFYVVSSAVTGRQPFWVAQLQQAIMVARDLTAVLNEFKLPSDRFAGTYESRQRLIDLISTLANRASLEHRNSLLERVFSILAVDPAAADCNPEMLTPAQVRELSDSGITIGSHSATHPILTSLSEYDTTRELLDSKKDLEAIVERPVVHFAFPNGPGVTNINAATVKLVQAAGYQTATTSIRGMLSAQTDLFSIPRQNIGGDLNHSDFAFKLEEHKFRYLLFDAAPARESAFD